MAHFDITPDNHDEVMMRLVNMVCVAQQGNGFEQGRYWYDEAHEYARAYARDIGLPVKHGAGIIAACSPNLEANMNFQRIGEIMDGTDDLHVTGRQRDKACAMLFNDPTDVLSPITGPKTWAFFWNIYAPSLRDHVTIDGRHADVIANRMRGWKDNKGIDRGGPGTRYESYEFITEDAASYLRRRCGMPWMTAVQVQAIVWCEAKYIELAGITTRGTPRKNGPTRKGQRYT